MVSLRAIKPKRFNLISEAKTKQQMRDGIREYLEHVKKELLKGYQNAQPVRSYRRTRKLARGFRISVPSHNFGTLTNIEPYSVFVIGPRASTGRGKGQRQAAVMRRKGWPSITDVSRETRKDYVQILNRRVTPQKTKPD